MAQLDDRKGHATVRRRGQRAEYVFLSSWKYIKKKKKKKNRKENSEQKRNFKERGGI